MDPSFLGPQGWTSQQVWDWRNPSLKQKPAVSIQDLASWVTAVESMLNIQEASGRVFDIKRFYQRRDLVMWEVRLMPVLFCTVVATCGPSGIPLIFGGVVIIFPRLTTLVLVVVSVVFVLVWQLGQQLRSAFRASLPGLKFAVPASSWWRLLLKSRTLRMSWILGRLSILSPREAHHKSRWLLI